MLSFDITDRNIRIIKGDGINLDTAETTENTTGEEGTGK